MNLTINTKDLFAAVMALDLDPIKVKLMHVASGEGWSRDRANAVEKEYRRFLCLMKLYPQEDTAPQVDVDTFWHYHILDTMKYAADCEQAFGYFLHHYPYVGLGDEQDQQLRIDSGDRMRALYESTFLEAFPAVGSGAGAAGADYGMRFGIALQGVLTAWCASPGASNGAHDGAMAWCASPGAKKAASNDATAWCASPGTRQAASNDATAWCASPGSKRAADAVAWCASPGAKRTAADTVAWCASPGARQAASNDATAWCASPGSKTAGGATAWCASPGAKAASFAA